MSELVTFNLVGHPHSVMWEIGDGCLYVSNGDPEDRDVHVLSDRTLCEANFLAADILDNLVTDGQYNGRGYSFRLACSTWSVRWDGDSRFILNMNGDVMHRHAHVFDINAAARFGFQWLREVDKFFGTYANNA